MDPFQNLLNFTKYLYGQEGEIDEKTRKSLEKLRFVPAGEKVTSAAAASRTLGRISDLQEVRHYAEEFFTISDLKAVQLRMDPSLIRRDLMARKKYLLDKFREAAVRCQKRRHKNRDQADPYSRFVTKQANLAVVATKSTSAVYLSKIFKYAVKKTILEHKREMGGDPWDEFFYRAYSINKENMRIELAREDIVQSQKRIQEPVQRPAIRMARLSDSMVRGEPRRSPSPHMRAIAGRSPVEKDVAVRRKKFPKIDVSPASHPRFRFGKVPHSPDGRTSLTRLFYIPLIDTKGVFS